jgi:hypothetical protein
MTHMTQIGDQLLLHNIGIVTLPAGTQSAGRTLS